MKHGVIKLAVTLVLITHANSGADTSTPDARPAPLPDHPEALSPAALAVTSDGRTLFIACATAHRVLVFDVALNRVTRHIPVPENPLGLALTKNGARLYVVCAAPSSRVCVIEAAEGRIVAQIPVGHTAMSPVLSPDERTLFVCNRFNHDVSFIDLAAGKETRRIRVAREPVAVAITSDGKFLLVANHIHSRAAEDFQVNAVVTVINTIAGEVNREIHLPEGAGMVRGVAVSPDGRLAAVTHLRSQYWRATTQATLGGINCNAVSLLDLRRLKLLGTVLLDRTAWGAANPWAVTWTPDGKTIAVTQAGTHEVSLIEAPDSPETAIFPSLFLSRMAAIPDDGVPRKPVRISRHLSLPGNGPRALVASGSRLFVANYFSDNLCVIDLAAAEPTVEAIALGPACEPTAVRKGEMLFNDATLCFQGWQSCASCHDTDARVDGLNWDLLNDGRGNPKNTKSLLWAHRTPPAMWLGVRQTAQVAMRAGIRHILFSEQPEEVAAAIEAYLQSLQPISSPRLANGQLSAAAQRGKQTFQSDETGCASCHPPPLYTDLKAHDVSTRGRRDGPEDRFYTPPLAELWRTAPYLHDGTAATMRDVLTKRNLQDAHGRTSHLSRGQLDDLAEYLLSL
jgi:YVTN family beta-propeller protein